MDLTPKRFAALAAAHGGDLARWPHELRDAAAHHLAVHPETARAVLAGQSDLDALLDAWRPMAARSDLREAIIAAALRSARGLTAWILRASVGAGLAAAGAAGLIVGVGLSAASLTVQGGEPVSAAMVSYDAAAQASATESAG